MLLFPPSTLRSCLFGVFSSFLEFWLKLSQLLLLLLLLLHQLLLLLLKLVLIQHLLLLFTELLPILFIAILLLLLILFDVMGAPMDAVIALGVVLHDHLVTADVPDALGVLVVLLLLLLHELLLDELLRERELVGVLLVFLLQVLQEHGFVSLVEFVQVDEHIVIVVVFIVITVILGFLFELLQLLSDINVSLLILIILFLLVLLLSLLLLHLQLPLLFPRRRASALVLAAFLALARLRYLRILLLLLLHHLLLLLHHEHLGSLLVHLLVLGVLLAVGEHLLLELFLLVDVVQDVGAVGALQLGFLIRVVERLVEAVVHDDVGRGVGFPMG